KRNKPAVNGRDRERKNPPRLVAPAPEGSVFFYFFLLNDGTAATGCRVGTDRCLLDAVLCFLASSESDRPDLGHDRFVSRFGGCNRAVMSRRIRDYVVLIRQGNPRRADDERGGQQHACLHGTSCGLFRKCRGVEHDDDKERDPSRNDNRRWQGSVHIVLRPQSILKAGRRPAVPKVSNAHNKSVSCEARQARHSSREFSNSRARALFVHVVQRSSSNTAASH